MQALFHGKFGCLFLFKSGIKSWNIQEKKKATKTLFEEENEARIRMFLTFSIKTKLFAWKCQIRKHNASFQNVDISDISKCRHFRDFSTLPKVEMSKCQFKIKHFILNFPIRKLEIFTQFWHFPRKRCKNVDFFFPWKPYILLRKYFCWRISASFEKQWSWLRVLFSWLQTLQLTTNGILKCLFPRL